MSNHFQGIQKGQKTIITNLSNLSYVINDNFSNGGKDIDMSCGYQLTDGGE